MIIFLWWLYYGLQLIWWLWLGWSDSQYIRRQRASPQDNACKSSVLFVILRIVFFMPSLFLWFMFFHLRVAPTLTESLSIDVYTRLAWGYEHRDCWPRLWHQHHYHCPHLWQHHHHPDLHNQGNHLSGRCPIKWRFLQKTIFHFPIDVKTFTFQYMSKLSLSNRYQNVHFHFLKEYVKTCKKKGRLSSKCKPWGRK